MTIVYECTPDGQGKRMGHIEEYECPVCYSPVIAIHWADGTVEYECDRCVRNSAQVDFTVKEDK